MFYVRGFMIIDINYEKIKLEDIENFIFEERNKRLEFLKSIKIYGLVILINLI